MVALSLRSMMASRSSLGMVSNPMSRIIIVLLSELLYIETFKNKSCGFETHSLKKENHGFLFLSTHGF